MKKDILVLGSLNMDIVARTKRFPGPGETVKGSEFKMVPGGKGANQAVAAARLKGNVSMAGRIGDDIFGQALLKSLLSAGVDTGHVLVTEGYPTGTALIVIDESAENRIVVVPGANGCCSVVDVAALKGVMESAKILMVQLEIPLETVRYAVRVARELGLTVIMDPAPALPLDEEILQDVDIILPNETEAAVLTGKRVDDIRSARLAAADLICRGVKTAVVKMGKEGAVIMKDNIFEHIPGFQVNAVDTTAAGDAFAGALAVTLVEGFGLIEAIRFANAAGALATTGFGAQTSMPDREAVERLLAGS